MDRDAVCPAGRISSWMKGLSNHLLRDKEEVARTFIVMRLLLLAEVAILLSKCASCANNFKSSVADRRENVERTALICVGRIY